MPESCSIYERLNSSPPFHPLSLRLRPGPQLGASEAQIIGAYYRRRHFYFYEDRNAECTVYSYPPIAQNIHKYTTSDRYGAVPLSSRTTVMAKRCGRKSPLEAFRISHPRATEARCTVSTINVTYDSVNDPACCEWHFSHLPCHFEKVTVRVTIGTRAFGGMPRRAATVRQLQDPRTENLVAMSLRPGSLPPRHGVRTCNSPFSFIRLGWVSRQCTKPRLSGLPPDVAGISEPQSMGYAFGDGIDGPNYKHITFSRARSRKEQQSTSGVVFSASRWRRSALLKFAFVSVFPRNLFHAG